MTESKRRILVIDDQIGKAGSREMNDFLLDYRPLGDRYEFLFESCEDAPRVFSADLALAAIQRDGMIDLVLLDVKFGSETDRLGFEILEQVRRRFPSLPVMMMTSLERDVENLSRSMEPGAIGFIGKRPPPDELRRRLDDAIEIAKDYAILGNSTSVRKLRREIARVSPYDNVPVLIVGERGTGKERVARALHHNGPRRDGPFVGLNCAGLNTELLESELYGHEKGAFTGALQQRRGYLDVACGGTLFLDEIGEVPVSLQVKLLRVLEERRFRPVGTSERELTLDVQLICATNVAPEKLVEAGRLRDDFFDRIAGFVIQTPPLRDYPSDIPELTTYFLSQMLGGKRKRVATDALDVLKAYPWPGNGRELRNVVWRAAIKSGDAPLIDIECIPDAVRLGKGHAMPAPQLSAAQGDLRLPQDSDRRSSFLSQLILTVIAQEADAVQGNAAAVMRDLFPGHMESKRYLGQVAWKLVDWNPRILSDPELRGLFEGCQVLFSSFAGYLSANPMTKRKLWDKLRRLGIAPPEI